MKPEKNGFAISSMTDMNTNKKVVYSAMNIDKLLQQNLKFSDYSKKIESLLLTFIAMNPNEGIPRPDKEIWRWKYRNFAMYVNVPDYKKFCESTEDEARNIIAKLYMKSLETYLSKRKDVHFKQLYNGVEQQFIEGGVLEKL